MKLFAILLHPTSASKNLLISPYSLRLLFFALHFLYADDFFFVFPIFCLHQLRLLLTLVECTALSGLLGNPSGLKVLLIILY